MPDIQQLLADLGILVAAFALAFPIALDRERAERPAGLRTFPIVAVACCAYVLIAQRAFPDSPDAQARVMGGIMTGMGFIGGGAILKDSGTGVVRGVTTAASLWNVGAIGVAVAYYRFELAIVLAAINFAILRWLKPAVERTEDASSPSSD
ncbi:MAG: MgtC/SapB family protein [Gemmatimonadota bacterium]|nr:MgtC/SapB family protein [Gemmatimonadota bacterium]